ncbi:DUF262 domain-containing protein [Cupriavidus sp. M-11]|uniref:DUF262 domain-containing protein n=1 Tax=Cupriavidus sp. M-11 TaxID=3233038 RepID=UPI003F8E1B5D
MMNKDMMPDSKLLTLGKIIEQRLCFEVPIYQRLYVWGTDQVRTLMEDLLSACERDTPIYYLGGTLVMRRGDTDGAPPVLELIDGQQRFTTLWLIAQVWGEGDSLQSFLSVEQAGVVRPRLSFAIRDSVNRYLEQCLRQHQHEAAPEGLSRADADGLASLLDAQREIRRFRDALPTGGQATAPHSGNVGGDDRRHYRVTREQFNRFLLGNVSIVQTEIPARTDLNKLFEVINNRGIQLQHHEILKARMLRVLETAGAAGSQSYAWLWDACAGMNGYVERNLAQLTNHPVTALFAGEMPSGKGEALANAHRVIAHLDQIARRTPGGPGVQLRSLADILRPQATDAAQGRPAGTDDKAGAAGDPPAQAMDEGRAVRSIFGFSVLLQHVLRIWLQQESERRHEAVEDIDRIADKDLLAIFHQHFFGREPGPDDVRRFICLLWEVRYLFDKFIIKWVTPDNEGEVHLIRKLRLNTSLVRDWEEPESLRAFSLLQSMLYHSQQITTQYWVTPLLAFLHRQQSVTPETCTGFLQHLDNFLLCTEDTRPLIERSRDFLGANAPAAGKPHCDLLRGSLGVGFPHYWFYKLEYVLWHRFSQKAGEAALPPGTVITAEKLRHFRITARNSVEHVFPQTPPPGREITVTKTWLDAFGNLTLVSRSINSEFGNKSFEEKRARFNEMNQVKLDSLKSALVYAQAHWRDTDVEEHQESMKDILSAYLATDWRKDAGQQAAR